MLIFNSSVLIRGMQIVASANKKKLVAFQGNRGAYSEAASRRFFGKDVGTLPCHSFDDVFDKVRNGDVSAGVLPIENSLTGPIYRNYDLQLKHKVWIIGETQVRIKHNLIAHHGTGIKDIKRVYSHPQGIFQCENFLSKYPNMEQIPAYDTAGSVQIIKENGWKDAAAIASRYAAELYGMNILKEDIEDIKDNYTRFIIIQKKKYIAKDANKTSIVFSTENIPGILFKCLSVFALRDIGMSKIESRPLHGKPWEYFFYIDIEDKIDNERCKKAISHLKEIADFLKVLGSYKRWEEDA